MLTRKISTEEEEEVEANDGELDLLCNFASS